MTSLPPLPDDMKTESAGKRAGPSPFSGGLDALSEAYDLVQSGYQKLAAAAPSLAPFCADQITKLRMAIPNAPTGGTPPPDQGGGMQQAPAPGGMAVPPLAMQ